MFDPKTLSEKELFQKQFELIERRLLALRLGKFDVSESIQNMIQMIETEQRERLFDTYIGKFMTSGIVIETDPDLKAKDLEKLEKEIENTKSEIKPERPIRRPIRTSKPRNSNE